MKKSCQTSIRVSAAGIAVVAVAIVNKSTKRTQILCGDNHSCQYEDRDFVNIETVRICFENEGEHFCGSSRTFRPIEMNVNIYLIILWVRKSYRPIEINLSGSFVWAQKDFLQSISPKVLPNSQKCSSSCANLNKC